MPRFIFTLFILVLVASLSPVVRAQLGDYDAQAEGASRTEGGDESDSEDQEGFTGTYAEDEDPDHPDFEQTLEEEAIFGQDTGSKRGSRKTRGDDAEEEDDEELSYDEEGFPENEPNYLLKFTFDSTATFYDRLTGDAYMEIDYRTTVEQEVTLNKKRFRAKGRAEFETNIIGNYAGNELFTCKLEIEIKSSPVQIMTLMRDVTLPEDDLPLYEAAVQIKLEKNYKEDWYSNCTAIDGSLFNTRGDPEKYNLMILEDTSPSLNAVLFEEFIPGDDNEIEIIMEPLEIEDLDVDTVLLTGKGTLLLEVLTGG